MRRIVTVHLLIALLAFLLSGCGGSSSGDDDAERVPVEVSEVVLGDLPQTLSFNGDIEAEFEVKVFSKIDDRIEEFFVDEGDYVSKGDPLARILATTTEQTVRQAKAGLVVARAQEANLKVEYDRAKRLRRENAMSQQQFNAIETQYEAATAQVEQAEAALTSAQSMLDDATVTAPISGIIGERDYDAGDKAPMMEPLLIIVQMDRVKVRFDATEVDLGELAVGQRASVRVKSYPERVFNGTVKKISPVLDPQTRMAEIEVLVSNAKHELKPGMYARVEVTTGVMKNVIVVPRHIAIEHTRMEWIEGKDIVVTDYYVFVVNDDKAEQRKLDVQYINHEHIAVSAGIDVGERVVILGQNNLREGSLVSVVSREGVTS